MKMPLSAALIAYLVGARPAASTDNAADAPAVKHSGSSESGQVVSVGESRAAPCGAERPSPPKKRRRRGPCDLAKILKDAHDRRPEDKGACCKKQCDRKFADETNKDYRADWLAAEHSRFHSLESEPDRKAFVLNRLPFVEKDRRHLRAASKIVCGNFFKEVFGVSNNVIYAAKGTPGARASSCVDKSELRRRSSFSPKRENVLSFLDMYSGLYGEQMPHKPTTVLYIATKNELYSRFKDHERHLRRNGAETTSKPYFNDILRRYRPRIKTTTRGDFMKCDTCTDLSERLHGAPGIVPVRDSRERLGIEVRRDAHLLDVEADRQVIASRSEEARRCQSNGNPLEVVCMSVDAANQTAHALPMVYPPTHASDKGYSERQKVMAAMVEGLFVDVHFTPLNIGGGSNLVCTAIWYALVRLSNLFYTVGATFRVGLLHLQLDNCVGENKNNIVMAFLASLVNMGVIGVVEVCFMMVGHTHIKLDQVFSRFAIAVRGRSVFTRSQQARIFKEAYKLLAVHASTLRNLGNFKGLFMEGSNRLRVNVIKGITKFGAFRIEKHEGKACIRFKATMHSQHWGGITDTGSLNADAPPHAMFTGAVPSFTDIPRFTLTIVPFEVIRHIKRRLLSTRPRLEALYALDKDSLREAISEQEHSVKLLQTSGDLPFDLPMGWLDDNANTACAHNQAGLEEVSSSDDGEACSDNAEASSHDGGEGKAVDDAKGWVVGGTNTPLGPPRVGSFVFFKGRHAPFLVGRVVKVESDEEGDEVAVVHWFSPSNQKIRNSANVISVLAYANGRFSEDFLLPTTEQNRGKRTLRPDVGKEPTSRVIASCDKLTGSNKIPAPVKSKFFSVCANVRGAVSSPSLSFKGSESDDTESDDNEVADGEDVGGDAVDEEESDAETAELIGRYDSNQDGEMCKEGVGCTQDSSSGRSYSSPSRSKFPMTAAAYRPRRGPTSCRGAKPGE